MSSISIWKLHTHRVFKFPFRNKIEIIFVQESNDNYLLNNNNNIVKLYLSTHPTSPIPYQFYTQTLFHYLISSFRLFFFIPLSTLLAAIVVLYSSILSIPMFARSSCSGAMRLLHATLQYAVLLCTVVLQACSGVAARLLDCFLLWI